MSEITPTLRRIQMLDMACEQMLLAFAKGELTSTTEWEDLQIALGYAQDAMPGRYEEIVAELKEGDDAPAKPTAPNLDNVKWIEMRSACEAPNVDEAVGILRKAISFPESVSGDIAGQHFAGISWKDLTHGAREKRLWKWANAEMQAYVEGEAHTS